MPSYTTMKETKYYETRNVGKIWQISEMTLSSVLAAAHIFVAFNRFTKELRFIIIFQINKTKDHQFFLC